MPPGGPTSAGRSDSNNSNNGNERTNERANDSVIVRRRTGQLRSQTLREVTLAAGLLACWLSHTQLETHTLKQYVDTTAAPTSGGDARTTSANDTVPSLPCCCQCRGILIGIS